MNRIKSEGAIVRNLCFRRAFLPWGMLLFLVSTGKIDAQYADIPWSIPVRVTIGNTQILLTFGTRPNATDGFDPGIDTVAAPPAFNPYAYFHIQEFPNFLAADYRAPANPTTWSLKIVNANGLTSEIYWDSSQFPSNGFQTEGSLTLNDTCDMLQKTMCQFIGDQTFSIAYIPPVVTVVPFASQRTDSAYLLQNYPNPFNDATIIQYSVPVAGFCTLSIHSVLGELVCQLVKEWQSWGTYKIRWDGTNSEGKRVPSGVYIILLHAQTFSFAKKIILIK